jgi:phosphatidylserine/phosphatidylglycerophosphate/cardiolipin synthase-like enzyme
MTSRQIFKGRGKAEFEAERMLQTILLAELIDPSDLIWLVSPWVTDVTILDNRTGAYAGVEPTWARRQITLVEVLAALLNRGTRLVVATRPDAHNKRFMQRLVTAARTAARSDSLILRQDDEELLHTKGLVGDDYFLSGSMNFTESGIRLNEESIRLELDPEAVAQARLDFRQTYGAP